MPTWHPKTSGRRRTSPKNCARAVKASVVIVFLVSATSDKSGWVKRELQFGDENHKLIIPFVIDKTPKSDFDASFLLATHQWIETGGNWRKHFSYLKRLVAESIGTTQPSPSWRERVETLTMPLWAILRRTGLTAVQGVAIAGGLIALLVWMGILAATKVLPPKEKVPPPPPPVACVIEFTPPGAKGVWVDPQDRSDLGLRERPLAKPDVPLGVYLQAFLDVVDRSHPDVNADGMLSQMATEPEARSLENRRDPAASRRRRQFQRASPGGPRFDPVRQGMGAAAQPRPSRERRPPGRLHRPRQAAARLARVRPR